MIIDESTCTTKQERTTEKRATGDEAPRSKNMRERKRDRYTKQERQEEKRQQLDRERERSSSKIPHWGATPTKLHSAQQHLCIKLPQLDGQLLVQVGGSTGQGKAGVNRSTSRNLAQKVVAGLRPQPKRLNNQGVEQATRVLNSGPVRAILALLTSSCSHPSGDRSMSEKTWLQGLTLRDIKVARPMPSRSS